ncbi:acylphosphatase [Candidatus Roizmanbacteria bacterium CG_4_9_14_3_um_filter_33_18]|uniref:acylphosphatase n=2 Tax=Candidatus Roizmaniibacteriota TaxID=1752723 RepID=A0A2M7XYN5_9BACT|nr:MAG: acylphosphatase [Candidatus Roizmanbacteria bacterium CG22_combo_CG10-13_8_21_14_all_34_12]PJA55818.1 MAG: acylphosphatase [Candidatus Roizmanbacteria bacterium CG_4_9_14_3_um_filter_33_18]
MLKQVHLYVKGDVIGVGFRAWTKIQAKIIEVTGWVRNKDADSVEAQIQGEEEKVKQIIELIKKGPPISHVSDVQVFWQEPKEIFDQFEIRK